MSLLRARLLRGPLIRNPLRRLATRTVVAVPHAQSHDGDYTASSRGFSRYAGRLAVATMGVGLYKVYEARRKAALACGIVGFVGPEPAHPYLVQGLRILQNRGYDSAGVATVTSENTLSVTKFASAESTSDSIDLLAQKAPVNHDTDECGIAHTRWATHGAKTDENAHPHTDYKNRIALIHNGTIENFAALKKELMGMGIQFKSQTDTEAIAHLIGHYMDEGMSTLDALKATLNRLEGSWGLAVISRDNPHQILAARNGSPLMVGIGEGRMWVASEHTAFARYTNEYIPLRDGEVAVVTADGVSLDRARTQQAPKEDIAISPEPYPHWTLKEIMDQPQAVSRALNFGSRLRPDETVELGGLLSARDLLTGIRNLVISACGTSLYASMYGARLMRFLKAFDTVYTVDAAEMNIETFPTRDPGMLVVSQSGETKDVVRALELAEQHEVPRFSIVNCVGSLIARMTNLGVYTYAGREHAVASTKAFITQVTVMALVAAWFSQFRAGSQTSRPSVIDEDDRGMAPAPQSKNWPMPYRRHRLVKALHRLTTYVGMTITNTAEQCKELAQTLKGAQHIFVLGKGFSEPIAMEGALKIKEITYIHAEGYSGGALKHGPFALIEDGTPIILIIPDDEHAAKMISAAHEVEARHARTIVITDNPSLCEGLKADVIPIPWNGPLTALLAVIPLQLLAYELAVARGIDPDKPKHLAKTVTVD